MLAKLTPLLLVLGICSGQKWSVEECSQLGFTKDLPKCSLCDKSLLKEFGLEILSDSCSNCCVLDETEEAVKKYAKATLEVCTCKFAAFPQIQAFVQSSRPNKYPNLRIKYVHGRDPIIRLSNAEDVVQEVVAIEKWNTDSVDDFLRTHLIDAHSDDSPNYLTTNEI